MLDDIRDLFDHALAQLVETSAVEDAQTLVSVSSPFTADVPEAQGLADLICQVDKTDQRPTDSAVNTTEPARRA